MSGVRFRFSIMTTTGSGRRSFTTYPVDDAGEVAADRKVRAVLASVPELVAAWNRVASVEPQCRSELAHDDAVTHWLRVSGAVNYAMTCAADALTTLHSMFPTTVSGATPFASHFAVARAGLEAASLALWLLGPDDPRLRIERHLRNVAREVHEERSFTRAGLRAGAKSYPDAFPAKVIDQARKQQKKWSKARLAMLRKVSIAQGLDVDTTKWVSFGEIVRDAATHASVVDGETGEVVWRLLSGLTHPSMSRGISSQNVEVADDDPNSPTVGVIITQNVTYTLLAAQTVTSQFTAAIDLMRNRKLRPADASRYGPR